VVIHIVENGAANDAPPTGFPSNWRELAIEKYREGERARLLDQQKRVEEERQRVARRLEQAIHRLLGFEVECINGEYITEDGFKFEVSSEAPATKLTVWVPCPSCEGYKYSLDIYSLQNLGRHLDEGAGKVRCRKCRGEED
jgi:hypothetical protein